ncbi:non-ribosomal peptide synthetase [Gloeobacter kilaueensis]|uniref:Cyclohexanecarboxylate-CoA ligase n=1 Tax=Gloeobacter kilaueensis (strain ATCC BAA-2537 / CCAP 1431/1 / ULC 316 / JS1) TaxID=1183438 RepID=U5QGP7_GLOK1|nr:non-ribosomal peptide synthetase [Gloeobacter kilaueensis]AGY58063.1 cyclohexanecarboxylate-CoA ligase [Gloeobacter kilaueensis JS1]
MNDSVSLASPALVGGHPAGRTTIRAPLSYAQQRLWFLDQFQPGNPAFNIRQAWRLRGPLAVEILKAALGEIVRRHGALRTTFAQGEDGPVQRVSESLGVDLPLVDLEALPATHREVEAQRQCRNLARHSFDLANGPLIYARLFRLAPEEHILALVIHHIVGDGWSIELLISELATLYKAFLTGEPSPLPPLAIQYTDFSEWQQRRLAGERVEQQLSYWKERLADAPAVLELPTDHPRPPVQTYNGALHTFNVSPALVSALKELAREEGTTLFTALLAAFQVLLFRYTGQTDLLVGTSIANRDRTEIEPLIGFFVNLLVLRTDLGGEPSFRKFLSRAGQVTLEALDHQDLPFEKLVEALQPERSLSHTPLFQVLFVLQVPEEAVSIPNLAVESFQIDSGVALYDLILSATELPQGGLRAEFEYNTDLFDPETIERMAGHLLTLLESLVADPDQPITSLPLLTAQEKQLFREWNATDRDYPRHLCIHQLFEQQVERTPEAVALVWDEEISYRELNERANQLAHHLQSLGVGAEVPVGICLERSPELIVSLLAVLKAGGAYVPLDPAYPTERLAFLIQDAGLTVLVSTESLADELPAGWFQLVLLDSESDLIASSSTDNPETSVTGENLAYVLYTSGSTGTPKGVLTPHKAVLRLLLNNPFFEVETDETFLQLAPVAFDASTFEIWAPLLHGATLVLAPARKLSLAEIAQLIEAHQITTLWLTAGLFHLMLTEQLPTLAKVRQLLAGGDVLSLPHVRKLLEQPGERVVINGYGPTESTTFACCYRMDRNTQLEGSVPIGKPIANTRVYVLDARAELVPVGVVGELFIGGDGLARGYLNRPELTAEKFVSDPFSESGGKLYRTGDLVRWQEDGVLEFVGRLDNQVKLRGFRIELGEIETVLSGHPGVREAAVLLREEASSTQSLVAYVVSGSEPAQPTQLRAYLKERLPEYMVPSAFVSLEALPLTANGKLDRKALPAPEMDGPDHSGDGIAPRTPLENILTGIWSEVLGRNGVGVEDNFFDLGGHSLLATLIISRVRKILSVEIPLQQLFTRPTIASLAEFIEVQRQTESLEADLPVLRHERLEHPPLSYAQQRLWFLDQWQPGDPFYNVPAALHLGGPLDPAILEAALNALIARHETLRTTFQIVQEQPRQIVASALELAVSLIDLQQFQETERAREYQRLSDAEARRPFDLAKGPLLRAVLFRFTPTEHVLLLTMHHIVSDGWSIGVFIQELAALYAAFQSDQPSPLPPLPIQYADFALWQRQWLRGKVLEEQLSYWQKQLTGAPEALNLPTDYPRPPVQRHDGATHAFALPASLTKSLERLAAQESTTLFMVLLAAFKVLLSRYSRQEDIVVGTPIANRNRAEIEPLIGFFVNTLVLRTDLGGEPSFRELLARVRQVTLEAFDHQDLPFEKLVEHLQPERLLSHNPLFQVMFILQNAPRSPDKIGELVLDLKEVESNTAKFDLTLAMEETAQGVAGVIEYDTDLFEMATIERMAGHLLTLLEAAVTDPDQAIASLPLLTEQEKQLFSQWNDTERDYPRHLCIHQLFEQQVERTPEAVALVWGKEKLSYRELNHRANQLAHHLQSLGVGAEVLVGICLERSPKLVVSLLAVLKAGGAYVPLDPNYPAERLAFMIQDVEVLVSEPATADRLPATGAKRVLLDGTNTLAEWPRVNPTSSAGSENLAYVIYTSGSTGKPKGVAIAHRSAVALIYWAREVFSDADLAGVLASTSICFDLSVFELFVPLSWGGSVILAANALDLPELEGVSLVNTVPSAMAELVRSNGVPASVRTVNLAGEPLQRRLVDQIYAIPTVQQLFNLYGPSEDTTYSTFIRMERQETGLPTIGRPIANTQIYILDAHQQRVPVGVPGELFIGGEGLARGYLKRPELTAEKFVPDPFAQEADGRLYRTGDLARWRADGTIEFLGRLDFQVKIRGFRIELGEIEAALLNHPEVREVIVVAREDNPGDLRLVAYISPHTGPGPTSTVLRAYLKEHLPEYMVPSAFVFLEALPLSPNGKVDRKALPAPTADRREIETDFVAPDSPVEEVLAGIWSEVLKREPIGVEDNFFALGGHSLLATQVLSRTRNVFRVELSLRSFFAQPTILHLARLVSEALRESPSSSDERIVPLVRQEEAAVLAQLGDLSDEEVQALLGDLLEQEEQAQNE